MAEEDERQRGGDRGSQGLQTNQPDCDVESDDDTDSRRIPNCSRS